MAEMRSAHPYFLYDAIQRQPALVERQLESLRPLAERAAEAAAGKERIIFVGIGTSHHAAQVAERFMRHLTAGRAAALFQQSFEFAHYPLALGPQDAVVVITHTGTTTYSIECLRAAREAGALTIAIVGEDSGEGARAADFVVTTCEQEVAFAYTKSYTTALAALAILALGVARQRGILAQDDAAAMLSRLPALMRAALATEPRVREAAKDVAARQRLVFFGAGPCWATASEAALKVKETSYIAAEGFETEEILHGPFSEIDSRAAMVAMLAGAAADDRARTILRAAGALGMLRVAVTVPEAHHDLDAEHVIEIPAVEEWLAPFVHLVPLQLLTYWIALESGINPDTGRQDQAAHARAHALYKL
jgi:glucosamine--fructose-6-phosphate aminotransferase (isomerizing)